MFKQSQNHASAKKVLVTGSRGKSSIVRMLHAAFQALGLESHARITGVIPRELSPAGTRRIARSAGAHVEEMRWWLKQLPESTEAIVLENSAISPDLQGLAASWLHPDITILSNTLPDHQESWGNHSQDAARALTEGIPVHGRVVVPQAYADDAYLMDLLHRRRSELVLSEPSKGFDRPYQSVNAGLVLSALSQLGLDAGSTLDKLLDLPPDISDFKVINHEDASIAMAFSANDIQSTRELFNSLGWSENETCLVYNHRSDRPERLKSFLKWLRVPGWRRLMIIGDMPVTGAGRANYVRIRRPQQFFELLKPGDRVFGCGNTRGLPVELMTNTTFMPPSQAEAST